MTTVATAPTKQELQAFLASKLNRNLQMYFDSCQRCGLCAESCQYYVATRDPKMIPAYKAEQVRRLYRQPSEWSQRLFPWFAHDGALDEARLDALADVVFGSCTMCRRCTIACPFGIDTAAIMRAARGMLTLAKKSPTGLQDTVDTHVANGNNMAIASEEFVETVQWVEEDLQKQVGDPAAKIDIDRAGAKNLWVVNPREVKFYPNLMLAQAKILYAAGEDITFGSQSWDVTNYALFNGDDNAARTIAGFVLSEADRLGISSIICTECGHGFRQLRYLAPLWLKRTDFQVLPFVEVVARYIQEGRIKLDPSLNKERVTYHDPCNQARSGNYIEEPRIILRRSVSDFVELTPHGRDNWCCGGGGGALTMSEYRERRLAVAKVKAEQIRATGAKIVATSCHNCIDQLSELSRHYKLGVRVVNLCELIANALVITPKHRPAEVTVEVDENGFISNPDQWSPEVARFLAQRQGFGQALEELTGEHWRVIDHIRSCYQSAGVAPTRADVCAGLGITRKQFYELFPGTLRTALRVCGLPSPREAAEAQPEGPPEQ